MSLDAMSFRDKLQKRRREFLEGKTEEYKCGLPTCKNVITNPDHHFKDELSRKEFIISGLCQPCQDKIFKEE
jgi:hypothetical protein